ncbi:MAG: PAS domain S-box protein [Spirochaetales bacterium]|nr:PAS domain S-box protein [Spirochaetales bacterium]
MQLLKHRYKSIWSVVLGLTGFIVNFSPIHIQVGTYDVGVLWGLIFPMVVAMAWGWKYGLIASLLGLGGLTNWFLWPENGWLNVLTSLLTCGWFVWHGFLAKIKFSKSLFKWFLPFAGEALWRAFSFFTKYTLAPILLAQEPPFWAPKAYSGPISLPLLRYILVKGSINGLVVVLCSAFLINIPHVQKLMGQSEEGDRGAQSKVLYSSLIFAFSFWFLSGLLSYFILNPELKSLWDTIIRDPYGHDSLARFLVFVATLSGGIFASDYVRQNAITQEKLRTKEEQYRTLVESTSDWFWEMDTQGNFTYSSPRVESLLGYRPEELLSMNAFDLMEKKEAVAVKPVFLAALNEAKPLRGMLNLNLHRDGHKVLLESNGDPVFDKEGSLVGYRGSDRDITDRVKAQEEARLFKMIAENAAFGLVTISQDLKIVYLNDVWASMHGYTVKELQGQSISRLHSEKELRNVERIVKTSIEERKSLSVEIEHIRKDGTPFITLSTGAPVFDEEGKLLFITSTALDITERKRLEKQLNERMKLDSIGQLAGGIAHDFNNMLGGISGASELLESMIGEDEEVRECLRMIQTSTHRAADLAKKLLIFSRDSSVGKELVNLNFLLRDVTSILKNTVDKKIDVQTVLLPDNSESVVRGDASQLQSVFMNLAINSSHAMPQGGFIRFEVKQLTLDKAYCQGSTFSLEPGEYLQIRVSDNGSGIPEDLQSRVFEPFFTTKGPGKGTGLGLSAVYGTVKQHQGEIELNSSEASGTTFTIRLPRAYGDIVEKEQLEEIHGTGNILLVDDEEVMRKTGQRMLEKLGYRVTTAVDGKEAFSRYCAQIDSDSPFDLVVLDMIMPKMNGRECYQMLKEKDPAVRAVLCSGYANPDDLKILKTLGLEHYIKKPFVIAELSRMIAEALEKT